MARRLNVLRTACYCLAIGIGGSNARAETVNVYAAGSLRSLLAALAPKAIAMGIDLKPVFGGSGDLRDRIEQGATPDVLLSADMTSPRRLAAAGRAVVPAIAFARNRLCLVARKSLGLMPNDRVSGLIAPGVRIKTSKPVADPSGDYAMAMFALMDAAHPGAGTILRASAAKQMTTVAPSTAPGQGTTAALFLAHNVDVAVTYCSASDDITRGKPDLVNIVVPPAFDPKPVFGMALLSQKPAAARLSLLLLSEAGQAVVSASNLIPLIDK